MRFLFPRPGTPGPALLVPHPGYPAIRFEREELSERVGGELVSCDLLGELTEERNNQKMGWREIGLPGEQYRCFAFVQ